MVASADPRKSREVRCHRGYPVVVPVVRLDRGLFMPDLSSRVSLAGRRTLSELRRVAGDPAERIGAALVSSVPPALAVGAISRPRSHANHPRPEPNIDPEGFRRRAVALACRRPRDGGRHR